MTAREALAPSRAGEIESLSRGALKWIGLFQMRNEIGGDDEQRLLTHLLEIDARG